MDAGKLLELRNNLYNSPELIDSFLAKNGESLTKADVELVGSWKNWIRDSFLIMKYLQKYTIFLSSNDPCMAYGVVGLNAEIEDLFEGECPVMIDAVILPFEDRIIYDGIISVYRILFGPGSCKSYNEDYIRTKDLNGIITSLPFSPKTNEKSNEDMLRFYMKNERNREDYRDEIYELLDKEPSLYVVYHAEMGKSYARYYGKRLRDSGIEEGWFAILHGIIVASGKTREGTRRRANEIVPENKKAFVYIFNLKKK
jgi:hypothetical protein